ncbi:MAG: RtcB family protein [Bacteroidota bacterium]
MINGTTLLNRGWPAGPLIGDALRLVKTLKRDGWKEPDLLALLDAAWSAPDALTADSPAFTLAETIRDVQRPAPPVPVLRDTPLDAPVWGREIIDEGALDQLNRAMRLPVTVGGALMPDAHIGYGIPIGGVVAMEGAVAPYMVGVDIACRMMLSVFPGTASDVFGHVSRTDSLARVLKDETRFGIGAKFGLYERRTHDVLDDPDWDATKQLRGLKDKAHAQLGTSGTGNHFVDAGPLSVGDAGAAALGIEPGTYLAVLTHSGSRGVGATIANTFSRLAREVTPLPKGYEALAWLPLDHPAGAEYWTSMNLAGRYASACHHVIHRHIAKRLGERPIAQVENHHNFAWLETWQERDVVVHRKGATPAHAGVLGIVPGSQGHPSYVVRGLGSERSIHSASHGAGRQMSRKRAIHTIPKAERDAWLRERGVTLLAGGLDEAPQAYKDINEVLALQTDLIEPIAQFTPKLVLMAGDGKSER